MARGKPDGGGGRQRGRGRRAAPLELNRMSGADPTREEASAAPFRNVHGRTAWDDAQEGHSAPPKPKVSEAKKTEPKLPQQVPMDWLRDMERKGGWRNGW
jgi:hypothetical protein